MRIFLSAFFACFIALNSYGQLAPSKLFSNHMVLQRNQNIPVWGVAAKRAKVSVSLNDIIKTATADAQGNWKLNFSPMKEGGPYIMKVSSGKESITYTDVMLGEVWLCSGQSNMEFQLKNAYGYKAERKIAANVPVRHFYVPHKVSLKPETTLTGGEWKLANAGTLGDFSAVGYFYAKRLAENLHVTVGIINSSWGGTEAEDWISRDAMLASPELAAVVPGLPINEKELTARADKRLKLWAYRGAPVVNYTAAELAAKPASFFDTWQQGYMPSSWEWVGRLYSYRGQGFMQRTIVLDSTYAAEPSVITLGQTSTNTAIYINGVRMDKDGNSTDNKYSLPAGSWKGGANTLLVALGQQKDTSRFDIGLTAYSGDFNTRFADTTIYFADSKWRVMPDLSKPYHFDFMPNNNAFSLYNAMINPLLPYGIAGVLWYQGEANVERAYQYRIVLPLLINNWREKWKAPFPFLFVQLASFGGTQNSNAGSNWAELREAQNNTLKLPNTGTAITIDVGDAFNIHPKDKATVGYRLAASAFNLVYHVPGFAESPQLAAATFKNGYALINFTNAEKGLMVKDKYGYLRGFELAGPDFKFYFAQATIENNQVKVWCSKVPWPIAVRYAWTDAPLDANLFNTQGMPASPFRTDKWPSVSAGKKFE
jgi:sialate O-acetylesterase